MASSGKRKTTMAKLTRESRLRERRLDKQARKDARKRGLVDNPAGDGPGDALSVAAVESAGSDLEQAGPEGVPEPVTDA
jgi:hypothetical protein